MQEHLPVISASTVDGGGISVGGVLCLIVLVIVVIVAWNKKRKESSAFRTWAARYGYRYEQEDDSVVGLWSAAPFGTSTDQRAVDVFRGRYRNTDLLFFEYYCRSDTSDQPLLIAHQVVAIGLPRACPLLDISHEDFLSRQYADIDFENQRFNDMFKIQSSDRRFAFDVIHPRMMEWMMADRRAQSYRWRFEGPWLLSFRSGEVDLRDVFARADLLLEVYARVPQHVWSNP